MKKIANYYVKKIIEGSLVNKVGVAVLEPYDKKPQLLTILLTPDYKQLIFKYIKFICRDERITYSPPFTWFR